MIRLVLLRHTDVAAHWRGRCYGRAEAGLSLDGRVEARRIAAALPIGDATAVVSSPARRARALAAHVARRLALRLQIEPRLAERDFGAWEGRDWNAIWRAEGSSMDGMVHTPNTFRPGGGETTGELAVRVLSWLASLQSGGEVIAIAHGGPIAALLGSLRGEPPSAWLTHVPPVGKGVVFHLGSERDIGGWSLVSIVSLCP